MGQHSLAGLHRVGTALNLDWRAVKAPAALYRCSQVQGPILASSCSPNCSFTGSGLQADLTCWQQLVLTRHRRQGEQQKLPRRHSIDANSAGEQAHRRTSGLTFCDALPEPAVAGRPLRLDWRAVKGSRSAVQLQYKC